RQNKHAEGAPHKCLRLKAEDTAVASGVPSGCHRSTLYRWKKCREEIAAAASSSTVLKPGRRGPKILFPDLEERFELLNWVEYMRCNKVRAVTTQCLLMMSVKQEPRFLDSRTKQAAVEYLRRFRLRNHLLIRRITHKGRRKKSEVQVAEEFGHSMRYKLEGSSVLVGHDRYDHLFNMDETSIYADMNLKNTITFRGDHNVDVVQGAKGGKVEAEVHKNPLHKNDKVVLAVQKNAYCDERVMLEWTEEVWTPSVTFSCILVLDSLKVHKISTVRAQLEGAMTDVEFVLPGATMLAQPMDVAVMAAFERECRELYAQHHQIKLFVEVL
ncbi:DDE superfamily endonuclease, partial [Phytophthora infestans]